MTERQYRPRIDARLRRPLRIHAARLDLEAGELASRIIQNALRDPERLADWAGEAKR